MQTSVLGRVGKNHRPPRIEWIESVAALGRVEWIGQPPPVTEQNAIEVAKEEMGPCYSRRDNDCLNMTEESLKREGLFPGCERLIQAEDAAPNEAWSKLINEIPYCTDYFDYEPPTTQPVEKKNGSSTTFLIAGAGVLVLGLLLGKNLFQ